MFVVYYGENEVIVTTKKREKLCLEDEFGDEFRDVNDYDRREICKDSCVIVSNHINVDNLW